MRLLRMMTLLALLASCAAPAAADPLALRHGIEGKALVIDGGWPNLSVGYWVGPRLGLAVEWRLPAAAISGSVGTRKTVSHGPKHNGVDLFIAGGLLVPTILPGIAVTATPAIQLGKRGPKSHFTFGIAAPLEALLAPRAQLRVPVLLELRLGGKLGPLCVGLRGGAGPVFTAPGTTGFTLQWSLWIRFPTGSGQPHQATAGAVPQAVRRVLLLRQPDEPQGVRTHQ